MKEFNPCPFCGSKNIVIVGYTIFCDDCGYEFETDGFETEEQAIKIWNTGEMEE